MEKKLSFFIVFMLILSVLVPSFASASVTEQNIEKDENVNFETNTKTVLEELGYKSVTVKEEDNARSISYLDEKGVEYSSTYNLETEEYTFNNSDPSLSDKEKLEISEMATSLSGSNNDFSEAVAPISEPSDVVVSEGSSYTYVGTRYGTSRERDALIAAIATLVVLSLPKGTATIDKIKTLYTTVMVYLARTYDITYYKTVIYTRHDAYNLHTMVKYYAYSDSARTKLKSSDTRYHTVAKRAIR